MCVHYTIVTFRVNHRRHEMYIGYARLSVCLSVPRRIPTLLHGKQPRMVASDASFLTPKLLAKFQ